MVALIWTIVIWLLSAVAHENDIAKECRKSGIAHYSSWINDIKCSEMKGEQ